MQLCMLHTLMLHQESGFLLACLRPVFPGRQLLFCEHAAHRLHSLMRALWHVCQHGAMSGQLWLHGLALLAMHVSLICISISRTARLFYFLATHVSLDCDSILRTARVFFAMQFAHYLKAWTPSGCIPISRTEHLFCRQACHPLPTGLYTKWSTCHAKVPHSYCAPSP